VSSENRELGNYRLIARLGAGGMARVHLALSRGAGGFQKLVVLKTLREEFADDPEFRRMFLDEARIAARLNHPNVVHTYEVDEHERQIFIAMEYLEGQSLSAVIHRITYAQLPIAVGVRILADTAAGLHHAHELTEYDGRPVGLVHRDVSPQNIFVTYMGHTKLLDFGIAKGISGSQTRTGVIKGKASYMAPEQITGGATIDRRADLFAIGVILWELLAKRRLTVRGEDEIVTMHRRVAGQEPGIREVAPDAPARLLEICERAMAHDRNKRMETAQELQGELEAYLATAGGADSRAVAKALEPTFVEERSKVKRGVEEAMRDIDANASGSLIIIRTAADTSSTQISLPLDITPPHEQQKPKPERRGLLALAAGAVLVALGGAFLVRTRIAPSPVVSSPASTAFAPQASASASAASAPSTTAMPSASGPADPEGNTAAFSVRISAVPPTATVWLDDEQIASPYSAKLPAGKHVIRVRAPGFVAAERTITEADAGDVRIALQPLSKGAQPAPQAPTHTKKIRRNVDDTDPYK
jgi:eukaryotic-like serine/threonine-protein kinase